MKINKQTVQIRTIPSVASLCLVLGLVMVLSACGNLFPSDAGTGKVSINLSLADPRTLESGLDVAVTAYRITLTGPGGAVQTQDLAGTSASLTLAAGDWSITVDSINAAEHIIDSGSATFAVIKDQTVDCTVTLARLTGNGSVNFQLVWPAMVANANCIVSLPADAVSTTQTVIVSGTPAVQAVWARTDLASGYYKVQIQLMAGTTEVWATTDTLRIVAGQTNSSTITLDSKDLFHLALPSMVAVSGGTFSNGTAQVTVSDFTISTTEITQGQYLAVMGSNPSNFAAYADAPARPAEMVSWYDAIVFCNKLSLLEGKTPVYSINGSTDPDLWDGTDDNTVTVPTAQDSTWDAVTMDMTVNGYRLPTEAEWEFAARGGNSSLGYTYAGSDTIGDVAWYTDNAGSESHAVGGKLPNELGLYDMSGNVWEWCHDWYGDYNSSAQNDPTGETSGTYRVGRGASWNDSNPSCTVTNRGSFDPGVRHNGGVGFRIVRRTAATLPTTGLVGQWLFGGDANDSSGNANHGTVTGATLTTDRFGNADSAYAFDGVDDWIQVATPVLTDAQVNTGPSTISLWSQTDPAVTNTGIILGIQKQSDTDSLCLFHGSTDLFLVTRQASFATEVGTHYTIAKKEWHHTVIRINAGTAEYFVDGQLLGSQTGTLVSGLSTLTIGAELNARATTYLSPEGFFTGAVDDIYFYNRALTDSEITKLYTTGSTLVPAAPLNVQAASAGSGSVTLTWDPVFNASSYKVYYAQGTTATTSSTQAAASMISGNGATITGLTGDTSYAFVVTALNANGEGLASTVQSTKTPLYLSNFTMVDVAGGTFSNGTADVTLSSYKMQTTELTQEQYAAVMGSNPSNFTSVSNGPVEQVSWYDALVFCNKLSVLEGKTPVYTINAATDPDLWDGTDDDTVTVPTTQDATWDAATMNMAANGYCLPTEAEWEFAARGGNSTHGYTYAGSNTPDDVAWFVDNSGSTTHTVGTKLPNELGLYDMSGNVWEWCQDWYGTYSSSPQTDPAGASSGGSRVLRGGYWSNSATFCTVSNRDSSGSYGRNSGIGFRLVARASNSGTGGIAVTPVTDNAFTVSILRDSAAVSADGTLAAGTSLSLSASTSNTGTVTWEWYIGSALLGTDSTLSYGSSLSSGRYYTVKLVGTCGTASATAQYRFKVE